MLPRACVKCPTPSAGRELLAWLYEPEEEVDELRPALVYLHGGFALGPGDFADTAPFLAEDWVVLLPAYRGENGNPGHFELFLGEVDDAAAAVRWLAQQPGVDPKQIHAFGHSADGGMAALLSLVEDVPLATTGSCGRLYPPDTFIGWRDIAPFDVWNVEETRMRLLLSNLEIMQRPHRAYVGGEDELLSAFRKAEREMRRTSHRLSLEVVPGDHWESLSEAMYAYLDWAACTGLVGHRDACLPPTDEEAVKGHQKASATQSLLPCPAL